MTEKEEKKIDVDVKPEKPKEKSEKPRRQRKKSTDRVKRRIIVRQLPPNMSEIEFLEQTDPLPENEEFYFAPADWALGKLATTRAYMTLKNDEDIFNFRDRFDGYIFVDSKTGNEYPAMVEFAPFQGFRNKPKPKKDNKVGTIEQDPHYLAFLEKLEKEGDEKPTEANVEFFFKPVQEVEITSTPLLEYLSNKKAEKNAEKRRKFDEKKKRRDEDRQKKKVQVAKSIPEPIKEEKSTGNEKAVPSGTEKASNAEKLGEVDENGIMVRTVPSRLDRNQRQKIKEDKIEAKKEKERLRNQERKQRRQEKREKERAERKATREAKGGGDGGDKNDKSSENSIEKQSVEKPTNSKQNIAKEDKPAIEKPAIEKPLTENKQGEGTQKKTREVKKYSERRKEIRERAEQRRQAEEEEITDEQKQQENAEKIEVKKESFWVYKETSDDTEEKRRVRNKNRPSMQIYQPRKVRQVTNADDAPDEQPQQQQSQVEKSSTVKSSEKSEKAPKRRNSTNEKKKERKNSREKPTENVKEETKGEVKNEDVEENNVAL